MQIRNWAPLARPSGGLMDLLSRQIATIEKQEPGVVPDLRDGLGLCIGSDYSGDHGTPKYETYSFIVTNDAAVPAWDKLCKDWRAKYLTLPGDAKPREMSFKKLNEDNVRARALGDFLLAANSLRGLVLTVAVDKTIDWMSPDRLPENEAIWKPAVYDRVMRYSHFISLLIAGLSRQGHAIGWMTDQDKIADTPKRKSHLPRVFSGILAGLYLGHKLGPVSIGDNAGAHISFSDFLAIPDLIAGALNEVMENYQDKGKTAGLTVTETFSMKEIQPKTKEIIDWHIESDHPLKRLFLVINANLGDDGEPFVIIWPQLVKNPHIAEPSLMTTGGVFAKVRALRRERRVSAFPEQKTGSK